MADSASSTCEKHGTPNLVEGLLRNKVGRTYVRVNVVLCDIPRFFNMRTLDRLVVVDTSAAASDGAVAAVSCMSTSQWLGGGESLDPQDAKLHYVGWLA